MVAKKVPVKKVATKKPVARTDAKGRTGMGASTASGKKPLPKNFRQNEEGLRKIVLGAVLGVKSSKIAGAAASNSVNQRVYNATYKEATKGISKSKPGGQIHVTQTPKGSDLRSTKVQTPKQLAALKNNLGKRAENISNPGATVAGNIAGRAVSGAGKIATIADAQAAIKARKARKNRGR